MHNYQKFSQSKILDHQIKTQDSLNCPIADQNGTKSTPKGTVYIATSNFLWKYPTERLSNEVFRLACFALTNSILV